MSLSNGVLGSQSRFIPESDSYHTAVHKILNVLEDLPTLALSAMHRKLKSNKDYTPHLISKKTGWNRDRLIKRLRTKCLEFLSDLNDGDSLQEPLAKAMEVASLTLKLIQGCQYVIHFIQFPHEMKVLQNEIAMCIQLLDQRVELSVLKDIQVLLNPEAKLNDRTLRMSIRNLLTEYLFECSHIDDVPKCLLKVLTIIKKSYEPPYKHLTEMKIEEDVECILNGSASTKQVMWDLIPEHDLDLECGHLWYSTVSCMFVGSHKQHLFLLVQLVVKSQILAGGRGLGKFTNGLQGGVHIVKIDQAEEIAGKMLGQTLVIKQTGPQGKVVSKVYLCEKVSLVNEMYFAITLDRTTAGPLIIACRKGGTSIEDLAEKFPDMIIKVPIDVFKGITDEDAAKVVDGLAPKVADRDASIEQVKKLYNLFRKSDCTQLEVSVDDMLVCDRSNCELEVFPMELRVVVYWFKMGQYTGRPRSCRCYIG